MNHGRQGRLLSMIANFRRQFTEMKTSNERDLSQFNSDLSRFGRNVHSSCLNLSSRLQDIEFKNMVSISWLYHEVVSFISWLYHLLVFMHIGFNFCKF